MEGGTYLEKRTPEQTSADGIQAVRRIPSDAVSINNALRSGEPFVVSLSEAEVSNQDVDNLKHLLKGKRIHGWRGDTSVELSIDEVVNLWLDDNLPCNIVDSYVKGVFPVPAFLLKHNLLAKHPETEERTLSLYLSSSRAYTPLHVDTYGFAGWAFLFQGCKRWEFVHPRHYQDFHDDTLGGPKDMPGNELPADVQLWRVNAGARDLVYIPPGWLHRVWTDQPSFGFGGACAMPWEQDQILDHWRLEKELGIAAGKDLDKIFQEVRQRRRGTA